MAGTPSPPQPPPDPEQQPQAGGDNLMDWALREYMAAKIQRQHIMNQAGANMIYNHGRNIEKQLGLPPATGITPFPAPTTVQVSQPPAEQKKTPVWQQLALGGAMLGAGAALGPLGAMAVGAIGNILGVEQEQAPPVTLPGTGDVGIRIE